MDCSDLLAVQEALSSAKYCLVWGKSLHLSVPWFVHLISKMGAVQGFFIWVHRFLRDPWKGYRGTIREDGKSYLFIFTSL